MSSAWPRLVERAGATSIPAPVCEHVFVTGDATILHADVDSFFAAVEQRDEPSLLGRPVIVGAWVVLAASYEAKAHGVRTAMSVGRARRLCPDAIVVEPRMSAYTEASREVYRVFEDTAPRVEGLSIDEAFLDVRGVRRLSGTPAEVAARLRSDVRERVGLPITVGIARTKFLAKVASGVAKPDGLLLVPPERELAFLHPLPVERLWGVGPVTARRLHDLGVTTVGEVAGFGEGALVSLLGRASGRHLHALAQNRDPRPVKPGRRRSSIGAQRALGRTRTSLEDVDASLVGLVDRVARRLRTAGRVGRTVVLRLRFDDFSRATRSHTLPYATCNTQAILTAARGLLASAVPLIARHGITLVGVSVGNLAEGRAVQLALPFDRRDDDALDAALDDVRLRFGSAAVTRAVLLGRRQGQAMPLLPD
jgi:DNA polymerase IV